MRSISRTGTIRSFNTEKSIFGIHGAITSTVRIWRVTAKGRPLVLRMKLARLSTETLIDLLASPEPWQRQHARQVLRERGAVNVLPLLAQWLQRMPGTSPADELAGLEAMWTYQALNVCPQNLVRRLLQASQGPVARAAATRALYDWHDDFPDALT